MKGTLPTILDELGNRWIIERGDPGEVCIEAARVLRIKNPVYPHEVLLGRAPEPPRWQDLNTMFELEVLPLEDLRRCYVSNLIRQQLRSQWIEATK